MTQKRPKVRVARRARLAVAAPHGVDDDVDAAAGELADPGLQVLVLVGDRGVRAHAPGRVELLLARGGRHDPGAEGHGHVDGGQADAAARPEHEHPLALGHRGAPGQGEPAPCSSSG